MHVDVQPTVVNVAQPDVKVDVQPTVVNVAPADVKVDVQPAEVNVNLPPRKTETIVTTDTAGNRTAIVRDGT